MSKRAIVADAHGGVFSSDDTYLKIFEDWAAWFADRCKEMGVTEVDFLGDLLDNENHIHAKTATMLCRVFSGPWSYFKSIELLLGNHDVYHRSSNDVSPAKILEPFENVTLHHKPTVKEYSGHKFIYFPWEGKLTPDTIKALPKADVCYCHLATRGFEIRRGNLCDNNIDVSLFSKFKKTFSGHFHLPSTRENFTYVGSPYEITQNDMGDEKSFIVLDTETLEFERVVNDFSPKHVRVSATELAERMEDKTWLDNIHLRVINDMDNQAEYRPLIEEASKHVLTIRDRKKRTNNSLQDDVAMDIDLSQVSRSIDTIREYVDLIELPPDICKDKLVKEYMQNLRLGKTQVSIPGRVDYKRIIMRNFLSVGEEEVTVEYNGGTTVIFGQNMDTGDSNGSGKTAVFLDSLLFVLFGTTFKKLKKQEAIANSNTEGKPYVSVEFTKGSSEYRIERELFPSRLRLYIDGVHFDRTTPQTQSEILRIISSDYKTYQSLIALNISKATRFIDAKKDDKRKLWESILRLGEYAEMTDNAKKLLNDKTSGIKVELARATTELSTTQSWLDSEKLTLQRNQEGLKSIQSKSSYEDVRKAKEDQIKELQKGLVDLPQEKYDEDTKRVEQINEIISQTNTLMKQTNRLQGEKSTILAEITLLEQQLANLDSLTGAKCPTCYGDVSEEHIGRIKSEMEPGRDEKTEILKKKNNLIDMVNERLIQLGEEKSVLDGECNAFRNDINNNNTINTQVQYIANEINALAEADSSSGIKIIQDNIEKSRKKLEELSTNLGVIKGKVDSLDEKRRYYEIAIKILGDSGVKQHIFDKVIPQINNTLKIYLQRMGVKYHLEFDSAFETIMEYPKRPNYEVGNLSEGERQRLDLSVLLTFIQVAISCGTVKTNFIILDEALDTSMDSAGIGDFMSLLKDLRESNDISVFLTTHNPAVLNNQEMGSYKKAIVTKKDGISTLSQQI